MAETRVGYWYATGPADEQYTPGDPDFNLHIVVSDKSQFVAHVTVENAAGQQFPVPCSLIDEIATPPRPDILPLRAEVRRDAENRRCVRHHLRIPRLSQGPGSASNRFPIVPWHNPLHKFVKERNGECRVAVSWAPDHPFGDQTCAGWTQ